jgi:hypothetical protein
MTYQTKIETKTSLAEKGGTTIRSATNRGTTTRILILVSELEHLILFVDEKV